MSGSSLTHTCIIRGFYNIQVLWNACTKWLVLILHTCQLQYDIEASCFQKFMCLASSIILLSLLLVVCSHACVLLSFLFVFILYNWLYVNAYITLWLFYDLLWFNFFLFLCDLYISKMFCCVLISVNPHFLHFYWYWSILNHMSMCIISLTNHLSTNTNMKPNQWSRIRVAWI